MQAGELLALLLVLLAEESVTRKAAALVRLADLGSVRATTVDRAYAVERTRELADQILDRPPDRAVVIAEWDGEATSILLTRDGEDEEAVRHYMAQAILQSGASEGS